METRTQLGQNRTGTQMSPVDTADMLRGADDIADAIEPTDVDAALVSGDTRGDLADAQLRESYAGEADPLGSVPLPATLTGLAKSGVALLTGKRPQVLMDKLGERLAFERSGVRLYDALLVKCRAAEGDGLEDGELGMLGYFRDQEAQHFEMVAAALTDLGGDPTAQTPCADLVGVEGAGLVQAMNDPRTSLLQSLHVMLDAELIDNAGWELLIRLARAAGHGAIAERFEAALQQEAAHLRTLKDLVGKLTLQEAGAGDRLT
ncbi:MAG TPA: ferritin-like domain-containing protein [Roseateles sp.]